ncbi:MAG: YhcH/YjgK/YiaL family protein [Tissierellaceae bacterium]|nr:YhcH/YjgK/YiaL family protein [Tissierellaceae bacterium]
MIIGDIKNWVSERNAYSDVMRNCIDYLKDSDFNKFTIGKYNIINDRIIANVKDNITKPKDEIRPEIHLKYIDIHFIYSGMEIMEYSPNNSELKVDMDLLDKNDVLFYQSMSNETSFIVNEGMYVVFFPEEVHRTSCLVDDESLVKKVIIKVPIDEF